jgi:hypothetical protein
MAGDVQPNFSRPPQSLLARPLMKRSFRVVIAGRHSGRSSPKSICPFAWMSRKIVRSPSAQLRGTSCGQTGKGSHRAGEKTLDLREGTGIDPNDCGGNRPPRPLLMPLGPIQALCEIVAAEYVSRAGRNPWNRSSRLQRLYVHAACSDESAQDCEW